VVGCLPRSRDATDTCSKKGDARMQRRKDSKPDTWHDEMIVSQST